MGHVFSRPARYLRSQDLPIPRSQALHGARRRHRDLHLRLSLRRESSCADGSSRGHRSAQSARFLAGHLLAVAGSGFFAAIFILALQGVLLSVLGERLFRKISLFLQGLLIAMLLMLLLLFPVLSGVVPASATVRQRLCSLLSALLVPRHLSTPLGRPCRAAHLSPASLKSDARARF